MSTITQQRIDQFLPSAPLQSYDEACEGRPPLERSLIELGLTSDNKHLNKIAQNHITTKQPTYLTKVKKFFTEKWNVTKEYPQAGADKVKNIFSSIYQHPVVPFIGAGLLGIAAGSIMGLSIPAGFMLGVVAKFASIGLARGLEAITRAATRAFNWLKGTKSETEKTSEEPSWKQTIKIVPIAVASFALGLNSYHLALAVKIAGVAAVIGIGAFTLGTTLQA